MKYISCTLLLTLSAYIVYYVVVFVIMFRVVFSVLLDMSKLFCFLLFKKTFSMLNSIMKLKIPCLQYLARSFEFALLILFEHILRLLKLPI